MPDHAEATADSREARTVATGENRADCAFEQVGDPRHHAGSEADTAKDTGARDRAAADRAQVHSPRLAGHQMRERDRAGEISGGEHGRRRQRGPRCLVARLSHQMCISDRNRAQPPDMPVSAELSATAYTVDGAAGYRAGMVIDPGTEVERVLVVAAHPDDVDFGCGGTTALWTQAGIEVAYCMITNGDAGGFDPAVPRNEIAAIRQAEQRAAAKVVGVENVTFLGYPDGRLTVNLDLRCDISRVIRQFRPGRVVAQSPERNWTRIHASHPDHMAAGEATMCAIYPDARNPFAFPELLEDGLEAWTVEQTWVMGTNNPDRYVDVTDTLDRKIAALREHVSQMPGIDDLDSLVRNWLGFNAEAAGLPAGRYAEAFRYMATA